MEWRYVSRETGGLSLDHCRDRFVLFPSPASLQLVMFHVKQL